MFNQRNQLPASTVTTYSSKSTGGTSVAQLSYNQSVQQTSQPASTNTTITNVSTASDFKSKKISSILKSNAANTTSTSMNNYATTLDLSSVQPATHNTVVAHHLNQNARFITNNDLNTGNFASLDPTTGNVIYNQQLISIPIHELNGNTNQFINSQSNQRVNTSVSLKIRDQLNNNNNGKFNEPSNHEIVKQSAAQSTQILSHAKINNILNGLDTSSSSSTQLVVDNTTPAGSTSKSSMKTFKCPQCNKCFFYENYLRKHMLSKHSQSPLFSCSYCGKGFSNKSNAKSHVNNSHLDYSCPICGKMFKSKSLSVRHMQAAHNVDANSTLNKQFQPIKHVKMDVKILESGSNNIVSNNSNILMANNAGSIIIDNGSLQQHHQNSAAAGILNLIPISGTLDLSSLGAHAGTVGGTADVMDLNGTFHTAADLNNNINIINLSFDNSSNIKSGLATNYVNDLSGGAGGLTTQSIQTNGGSGNIALLPSTFTLNFLNNQQPSSNQQQQQAFVLNQTGFGQQQQQQLHQQTGNTTLNSSASYFI